ncbi:MAG: hypothetical protein ACM3PT_03500 [Deltaproteobacteria bacterium]
MVLIGIDGGATKISAWEVFIDREKNVFSLGKENVIREYRHYDEFIQSFVPVELKIQLSEMAENIELTQDEMVQGEVYIKACADVIREFAIRHTDKRLLVGIGMPGLKTSDRRGIVALANGPRMPDFADRVEKKLEALGVKLFSKIAVLGSDADYCGIGEEYSDLGKFRGINNAYYLGGGTGIADAVKLKGKLCPFDEVKEWIAKTWEMKSKSGLSLERYTSAGGIQFIYSRYSGIKIEELNAQSVFPPQILRFAQDGDPNSQLTMDDVSKNIAELIFERITTLYFGWQDYFDFINPSRPELSVTHPFRNELFDRIIFGQRLGDLMKISKGTGVLYDQMISYLSGLVLNLNDKTFIEHYLKNDKFDESLIFFSDLREAPAIGAGIDAYLRKNI